ncbi:hypothetical protein DH2020_049061 [Rehmannia glutinosa]|uniref:Bifunctional inhibitor/plant lipid transfer protein/seed storage helical domain-containing protein n=1 Tax=Rehmannia glutinosa TaxID=99300 RepID=A0ABR0U462_REHGL
MAHQQVKLGLALILVTMLWAGAAAQSSDCTNVLISMSPCLNYISGNSSAPSPACCTQLRTVVGSQPQCLCQVLNGGGSNLGLNINQTQALALPGACNVQTPPTSQCNGKNYDEITKLPLRFSLITQKFSYLSKTSRDIGDGSSDATSIKLGVSMLFFLVFVASYVSSFSMA